MLSQKLESYQHSGSLQVSSIIPSLCKLSSSPTVTHLVKQIKKWVGINVSTAYGSPGIKQHSALKSIQVGDEDMTQQINYGIFSKYPFLRILGYSF